MVDVASGVVVEEVADGAVVERHAGAAAAAGGGHRLPGATLHAHHFCRHDGERISEGLGVQGSGVVRICELPAGWPGDTHGTSAPTGGSRPECSPGTREAHCGGSTCSAAAGRRAAWNPHRQVALGKLVNKACSPLTA